MPKRLWAIVLMTALSPSSWAQLRLQSLPLTVPQAPLQRLTQSVDADTAGLGQLSEVRHLEIERLLRNNRKVLDTDSHGEAVVRSEILALTPSDEALARALALGYLVDRERALGVTSLRVVVFKAPPKMSTAAALQGLRDADPSGVYDYNHIYIGSGGVGGRGPESTPATSASSPATPAPSSAAPAPPSATPALPPAPSARPSATPAPTPTAPALPPFAAGTIRVGLIDTGVDASHPVFRDAEIHAWGCDKPIPDPHGTAVASLLLSHAHTELYAADVYCGKPTGGAVDAIVASLAWMASQHIAVINMSLVGPRNALLEHAVAALLAGGYTIVAAVGNDGPTAPPLFPAAYPDVVGVTGVDAARHVLIEAVRGPQVMFAARGADVKAATTQHSFAAVRGTSFASPVVAELLAERIRSPDRVAAHAAVDGLTHEAVDLGPPGRDLTYGFGLVGVAGQ